MLSNSTSLEALLQFLRSTFSPDGGTCPGMAIEEVVRYIENNPAELFPLQAVVLVTDGVFYDMPFPVKATTGLEAYKAIRFALGISVGTVSPENRKLQHDQLTAFVGSNPDRFFDLGDTGFSALQDVADQISRDLPRYVTEGKDPAPRNTWCGWRRAFACNEKAHKPFCGWSGPEERTQWMCYKKRS